VGAAGSPAHTRPAHRNTRLGPGGATGNTLAIASELNLPASTTIDGGAAGKDTLVGNWAADLNGTLNVRRFATSTFSVGDDLNGTMTATNAPITSLSMGGSLTQAGSLRVVNTIDPSLANIDALTVGQDLIGTITASGTIRDLEVLAGSIAPTASITAGNLVGLTVGPDRLSVGQNLAGTLVVAGD